MCNTSHDLWLSYSMPVSDSKMPPADRVRENTRLDLRQSLAPTCRLAVIPSSRGGTLPAKIMLDRFWKHRVEQRERERGYDWSRDVGLQAAPFLATSGSPVRSGTKHQGNPRER